MAFIPHFKAKQWTIQAAQCYENGCRCSICPLKNILETKCLMKITVIELVKKFGKPDIKKIEKEYRKGFTKY